MRLRTAPGSTDHNRADVQIRDQRNKSLRVELSYAIGSIDSRLRLVAVRVETQHFPDDEFDEPERLAPGVLRDLPYARWDRMAQGAVANALGIQKRRLEQHLFFDTGAAQKEGDGAESIRLPESVMNPQERGRRAEGIVRSVYPDLDPEANRFSTRTWNSLLRYANVSLEHLELLTGGVADPVAVLAERHDVAPATVRSWLHRAREAGVSSEMPSANAPHAAASRPPARRSRYQEHVLQVQLKDALRLMKAGRIRSLQAEYKSLSQSGYESEAEERRHSEVVREITELRGHEALLFGQMMVHIEEISVARKRASAVTRARVYIPQWVMNLVESFESSRGESPSSRAASSS